MRRKRFVVKVGAIVGVEGHKALFWVVKAGGVGHDGEWYLSAIGNGARRYATSEAIVAPTRERVHTEIDASKLRQAHAAMREGTLRDDLREAIGEGEYHHARMG